MPQVGNKKFAYNAAGIRQAMEAAKKKRSGRFGQVNNALQRQNMIGSLQKVRGDRQGLTRSLQGLRGQLQGNRLMGSAQNIRRESVDGGNRVLRPTGDRMYRPSDGPKTPGQNIKGPGIPNIRRPRPMNIRFPRG